MKFMDIPTMARADYQIDIPLTQLLDTLDRWKGMGLQMEPDFQRAHVWTLEQQERFVEYVLQEGEVSSILFNHPRWMRGYKGDFVLVDGLQRLTALTRFLNNEIRAFGLLLNEFEGEIPPTITIRFAVSKLKTRKDVLQWYVDLNRGGTVHTEQEIARVMALLQQE